MERLTYMNNHPEKLKNGATVIAKHKAHSGDGWVILAMWEKFGGTEYITWISDNDLSCYYGHYFTNIIQATEDYQHRVARYCPQGGE